MTWSDVKLDDLFRVGSSKRVLKSQWQAEGVPFYRGREVTRLSKNGFVENELFISEELFKEYSEKYGVPEAGDIVITAIGTIGNTHIVRNQDRFYFKDASVLWLKKTSDVSSEFINYWIKSPLMREQLDEGNGATVDTLTIKKLQSLKVKLPPLPEQKRIVAILDEAFAGIDTAIANTEKNLANARELFESYLQQVFSQRGDGWVEKTLGDICQFENGDRGKNYPSRSKFVDSGIAFINAGHIDDGVVDFSKMNYITEENYDLLSRGKIKLGDILFCLRGSLGKFALIKDDIQGAIASSLVIVRPHTDLSIEFLLHYLRSGLCNSMIEKYAGGAAQPNLGAKDLAKFSISMPPKDQQKGVSEKLDALMLEAERLDRIYREKLNSLKELKQSLLQKAFSGELTAEGDKLMDEAVA